MRTFVNSLHYQVQVDNDDRFVVHHEACLLIRQLAFVIFELEKFSEYSEITENSKFRNRWTPCMSTTKASGNRRPFVSLTTTGLRSKYRVKNRKRRERRHRKGYLKISSAM